MLVLDLVWVQVRGDGPVVELTLDGTRMASELGAVIYGFALDLEGQVVLA